MAGSLSTAAPTLPWYEEDMCICSHKTFTGLRQREHAGCLNTNLVFALSHVFVVGQVFYVIKGLVKVKVHESEFVVSTGGRFLVPRGNTYSILNVSTKESTLFFVQTKQPRSDTTETIATASPSAAIISTVAASNTESRAKRKSLAGGSTAVQPDPDSSERNPTPLPEDATTTAAARSRSPPPEASTPSSNKRRLTSARRLLSNTQSPTPPPFVSSSTEEVANSHDGADERGQSSVLA